MWTMMVVDRTSERVRAVTPYHQMPDAEAVWEVVLTAMLEPFQADPSRPARIEVCKSEYFDAWQEPLERIGVECVLLESLDFWDHWVSSSREQLARHNSDLMAPIDKEELAA